MLLPQHSKIMSYSERIYTVRINIDSLGLAKVQIWGFRGGDSSEELVCQCRRLKRHGFETRVQSLGQEDPLEEEMATHFSILAWKIPWTEEPGGLQSMGSETVRHN